MFADNLSATLALCLSFLTVKEGADTSLLSLKDSSAPSSQTSLHSDAKNDNNKKTTLTSCSNQETAHPRFFFPLPFQTYNSPPTER